MESASRPFHRKQSSSATFSKKLSNASSFSAKNAYDDVFNGPPKSGAPTYSSRIEDYNEIFGGPQASRVSSIPILDLSALDEAKVSVDVRSSKLDYSKIFGGFRDDDIAVSYEEMFAKPKGAKHFSDEARSPAKTASLSEGSDRLNSHKEEVLQCETPNQSSEGMKQFNMSYHKASQRSNDGTNGTTHVAQLRDVPGFTCFIDENHPLQKTEGDKSVPTSKADAKRLPKVDVNLNKKETSDGIGKFKSQSSWDKLNSIDKSFNANENSLQTHPSKTSSPSSLPADLVSNKSNPKRSMDSNFKVPKRDASKAGPADCSPSFSDEELDVNSEAAASAAALRKALEKAQASIRIAKELMERKKDGPQMFSKPNSKDGLDVRKRREDKVTMEGSRVRKKDAKEICESADVVLQVFTKSERVKARRSGKVAPDFKESGEIFIAKEVVGETNGKKLESAEDCEALGHFSEPVSTAEHRTATLAIKHADGRNSIMLCGDTQKCGRKERETAEEILKQLDGNCKVVDEAQELKDLDWKLNAVKMAQDSTQEGHEQEENEKAGVFQEQEETEEKRKTSSGLEKCEKKLEESLEPNENKESKSQEGKVNNNEEGLDEAQESIENEKQEEEVFEEQDKLLKDVREEKECEKRVKEICQQDEIEERLQAACEWVDYKEVFEVESNEKRQNDDDEGEDNEKRLDTVHELDINNKRLNGSTSGGEESEGRQEDNRDWEGKEKILLEACKYEETVSIQRKTNETAEVNQEAVKETINLDACKWDADESLNESLEAYRNKEKDNDLNFEENERISDVTQSSCQFIEDENGFEAVEVANSLGEKEICKTSGLVGGAAEHIEIENKMKNATESLLFDDNPANIGLNDTNSGPKQTDQNEKEPELASNLKSGIMISMRKSGEDEKKVEEDKIAFDVDEQKSNFDKAHEKRQWVEVGKKMEASQPPIVFKGEEKTIGTDEEIKTSQSTKKSEENLNKAFAVEEKQTKEWVEMGKTMEASQPPSVFRGEEKTVVLVEEIKTSQSTEKSEENLNKTFTVEEKETKEWVEMGKTMEASQPPSVFKGVEKMVVIDEEIKRSQITEKSEENRNKTFAVEEKETEEWVEMGKTMEASQPPSVFKGEVKTVVINEEIKTSQITEKSEENLNETFAVEEKKAIEIAQEEVVEKEHPTKNDEASKREREQEKDRMAVERAIREARERAFAEARERAERAAVERATAEARQRVMVEAREKFEKASAATKSSAEKASIKTKLKAERAAVERATAEARERALEKALSQKATSGAREQAERFVGVSRDNGMRQSFPSFDAQKLDGTNGESAQRCKARSESHQMTMERAAKALAEKNMRDLLAQKEQAERNRLAETLDAEVKRWASGKERNLRALLSTLQYILGPDSGWQPVSLTDIITIDAVRKAYRKATLHVHPDKLQQRGASIQQKYICEKVFDLLKVAWNKFNSEER